ncbi:hypothetical protein MLD38_000081 [Melastoma candidum]|uniref:Uncharacterized protein n=1 Tax=Melastoma candidum TaxID=119954 RepID=A0ACB9S9T4_9MYRT|nr:hypothetical protein MLD38_000081 [Melastoma candidum]
MAGGMKLHSSPISTTTMRALAALYEKDFDFQFCLVNMKSRAHKSPAYLSLNPFGQVPALEDGDLKRFGLYLPPSFFGIQLIHSGREMAILSIWVEVEAHQFDPVVYKLRWELVYKTMFGISVDTIVVEENEAKLAKVLDVYEARLEQSKYLAGDCYTLADLHHLPAISYLMGTHVKKIFDARPRVSTWASDILARPAWAKVQALKDPPPQ